MDIREFTRSGAFVAIMFALVAALLPFGIEEIGEATGLFRFPARKTIFGRFRSGARASGGQAAVKAVEWDRYRQDIEEFSAWADGLPPVDISLPPAEVVAIEVLEDEKPARRIWPVPVAGCTASDPRGRRKGYVYISGFDHPFEEGSTVAPSDDKCGYEIVSVGERTVWFRAVCDEEGDVPMGVVRFPEFTRVTDESLIKGKRIYSARDAFPLASGGWLMIDSLMPPDCVRLKILGKNRHVVASMLCVVIGEKGGRK